MGAALKDPAIGGLLATIFAAFAATFSVVASLGPLITATTGLGPAGIGAMQAFIGFGSILGLTLGGRIDPARGDQVSRRLLAVIAATMVG